MNKSFKLHVMLQILILFVIYLFVNRLYAQYLAYEFIQDKVNLELLNLVESQDTFTLNSTESKTKFFSNTRLNSLVKCSTTHRLTSDLCEEFKNPSIDWTQTETVKSESIKFGKHSFNGVTWKIVHKKNNLVDDYLAVDESEINLILEQTWETGMNGRLSAWMTNWTTPSRAGSAARLMERLRFRRLPSITAAKSAIWLPPAKP